MVISTFRTLPMQGSSPVCHCNVAFCSWLKTWCRATFLGLDEDDLLLAELATF
jgi:hypothetical protein